MLRWGILLLLGGCVSNHSPHIADTKFDDSKRDWAEVFVHEIKVAAENDDYGAYYFFLQELIKEDHRRNNNGEEMDADPELEFYYKKDLDPE